MRLVPIVPIVLLLSLFAGCAQTGEIIYDWHKGVVRAINPPEAETGASLTVQDGTVKATVGAERPPSASEHLWFLPWLGAGLMGLGLLTLVLRSWFKTVPLTASLAAIGLGALFIFLPTIVQEAWWLVAGGLILLALMYAVAWLDNRTKLFSRLLP